MDALDVLLTFITGLGVRLAAPLAVTALAVWLLRKLDARWQTEAELQWQLAPAMVARKPCWETRGCPPERRAQCAAHANPAIPCWQVFRDGRGQLKDGCLDCEVFRTAPVPA